mmetsp:Transcript_67471/g.147888  ORF Transcript_67471/g.147888 Transcript_67471/m.147888 type:complete len:147 (-) Transcript_67471:100-540(-)
MGCTAVLATCVAAEVSNAAAPAVGPGVHFHRARSLPLVSSLKRRTATLHVCMEALENVAASLRFMHRHADSDLMAILCQVEDDKLTKAAEPLQVWRMEFGLVKNKFLASHASQLKSLTDQIPWLITSDKVNVFKPKKMEDNLIHRS